MSTSQAMVAPNGFWIRTHFYRDGDMLRARSFMVAAGEPMVFDIGIDIRKIEKAIRNYHKKLEDDLHRNDGKVAVSGCSDCPDVVVGSLFSSIGKIVKKVAKSKLVKGVASVAKSVVKNKITGAAVSALAVAFPPVGVPAAAGFAAANAAVAAIDRGNAVRKAAVATLSKAKAVGKKPVLQPKTKLALAAAVKLQKKAQTVIKKAVTTAQYSADPKKKADAQRVVALVKVATQARSAMKQIPVRAAKTSTTARAMVSKPTAVATGLVVTDRGQIVTGRFNEIPTGNIRGKLYRRGKSLGGQFAKIGCSNPWPNIRE